MTNSSFRFVCFSAVSVTAPESNIAVEELRVNEFWIITRTGFIVFFRDVQIFHAVSFIALEYLFIGIVS